MFIKMFVFRNVRQLIFLGDISLDIIMYVVKLGIFTWKIIIVQHPVVEK